MSLFLFSLSLSSLSVSVLSKFFTLLFVFVLCCCYYYHCCCDCFSSVLSLSQSLPLHARKVFTLQQDVYTWCWLWRQAVFLACPCPLAMRVCFLFLFLHVCPLLLVWKTQFFFFSLRTFPICNEMVGGFFFVIVPVPHCLCFFCPRRFKFFFCLFSPWLTQFVQGGFFCCFWLARSTQAASVSWRLDVFRILPNLILQNIGRPYFSSNGYFFFFSLHPHLHHQPHPHIIISQVYNLCLLLPFTVNIFLL